LSDTISFLSRRLTSEKEFAQFSELDLPTPVAPPAIGFLGLREYWGSIMTIGLVEASRLGTDEIRALADEFYGFTHALLPFAGRFRVGLATTRLGSFGLIVFVFHAGCEDATVRLIQECKRGSAWKKDYCVCWALDAARGRVHTHRGFPLTMFPGRRYLERLIAVAA